MIGYFRRKEYEETDETIVCHDGVFPVLYDELKVSRGELSVRDTDLSELDVFYFRAVGREYDKVNRIVEYAKQLGKPIVDTYLLNGAVPRTKKLMHETLADPVNHPEYAIARKLSHVGEVADEHGFEYPIVIKVSRGGRKGLGTFYLESEDEVQNVYAELNRRLEEDEGYAYNLGDREWIVQQYIPNKGDYRAMIIGGRCIGITKRGPKPNELVMSSSLRGSRKFRNNRWPRDVEAMAIEAAKQMSVDIAGVDLVRHKITGEPYVIEVNEAPRYKTFSKVAKVDVGAEIVSYLRRLASGRT